MSITLSPYKPVFSAHRNNVTARPARRRETTTFGPSSSSFFPGQIFVGDDRKRTDALHPDASKVFASGAISLDRLRNSPEARQEAIFQRRGGREIRVFEGMGLASRRVGKVDIDGSLIPKGNNA